MRLGPSVIRLGSRRSGATKRVARKVRSGLCDDARMDTDAAEDGRAELLVDELELSTLRCALVAARDNPALVAVPDVPQESTAELIEDLLSALQQAQAREPDPAMIAPLELPGGWDRSSEPYVRHWLMEWARQRARADAEYDERRSLVGRYLELARHSSYWSSIDVQTVADQIQQNGRWED